MRRALPPLAWFRAFDSAARHLNFTAAARELHLTQSAISQQVRALESRLGVPLFHRKARGLALTDDGRRLLPDVATALGTLAAATRAFEVGPSAGLVTVVASVSFNQWFITPGLHRFMAANPGTRVRIVSAVWPDDFHARIADVEIRFGPAPVVGGDAERLLPDELIVVASADARVDPDRLHEVPLIETVGTSDGWRKWSARAGCENALDPSIFVDNYGLAIDLARAGAGVALASSLLASRSIHDGTLVRLRDESIPATDGYFLATQAREGTPAAKFADWLKQELRLHGPTNARAAQTPPGRYTAPPSRNDETVR